MLMTFGMKDRIFDTHIVSNPNTNKIIIAISYLVSYRLLADSTLLLLGVNTGNNTVASLFFPAAGLTVAFILYFGIWIIPLIPINILYSSLIHGRSLWNVIFLPTIITIGYGSAGIILKKILHFDSNFRKLKDGISFLIVCTGAPLFIGFAFGLIRLYFVPHANPKFVHFSIDFFIGDVVGIFTFTPLLLVIIFPLIHSLLIKEYNKLDFIVALRKISLILLSIFIFTVFIFNQNIFISPVVLIFFVIPLTFYSLEYGLKGSIITNNIIILLVLLALKFVQNSTLFDFQVVIFSLSGVAIIIGVVLNERDDFLEQLKNQKKEIEEIVEKRTRELEDTNKELEFFTYSVSHDLRNPIANIDNILKLLRENENNAFNENVAELLNKIENNSVKMKNLIEDLLRFFTVNQLNLKKENFDMQSLIFNTRDMFADQINKKSCEITIDLPYKEGFGDSSLLSTVWNNLISNALKFTSKRDCPIIKIGSYRDKNNTIVYFIKDNGVGLDMNHATNLFEPFQRFHKESDYEGTGIGLALVKKIITRHGGEIWVDSEPNKGSTFFFTL